MTMTMTLYGCLIQLTDIHDEEPVTFHLRDAAQEWHLEFPDALLETLVKRAGQNVTVRGERVPGGWVVPRLIVESIV